MKTLAIFCLFFLMLLPKVQIFSQESKCKVLKEEISETYQGTCKNGLAHGLGKAKGIDEYHGDFKKGLPNGQGSYTWKDGSKHIGKWKKGKRNGYGKYSFKVDNIDSVKIGFWKMDKYIGATKNEKGYRVELRSGIKGYSFQRIEGDNKIEIKIQRTGARYDPEDLSLTYTSGNKRRYGNNLFLEEIRFPFQGLIKFSMMNELKTQRYNCRLKYSITKPGSWVILIRN